MSEKVVAPYGKLSTLFHIECKSGGAIRNLSVCFVPLLKSITILLNLSLKRNRYPDVSSLFSLIITIKVI